MTSAINDGQIWAAIEAFALKTPKRFALQANGLRPSSNPAGFLALSKQTYVGQQTWGDLASMSATAAQITSVALAMQCSYLEMYVVDCIAANDAVYATWAAASPNLPTTVVTPHRRVGAVTRRILPVPAGRRVSSGDRRAASENHAGDRRAVLPRRTGPVDRRSQPASRP